ncbi:MAG: SDR family NAD(P)-dependent oxidoreductase [Anaerolineales bacterium]
MKLFKRKKKKGSSEVYSIETKLGELVKNPATRAILEQYLPKGATSDPQLKLAYGMSLKKVAGFPQAGIDKAQLAELDAKLKAIKREGAETAAEKPLEEAPAIEPPPYVNMRRLEGKVVLLTGASAGLGKQMSIFLAKEGAKLAICARRMEKLNETAALCEAEGAEVLAIQCDVSVYEDVQNLVQKTVERFGTVDVLINNANFEADRLPFLEQDISMLDKALHTGVYAHWHLMKLCYPYLKGKPSSIINFTSGTYQVGLELYASYAADKGAIRALSMVVAREWGVDGIRVNTISPVALTDTILDKLPPEYSGWVKGMMKNNALKRVGVPFSDIAPVVLFLATDESRWVTGQNINVDGGQYETIHV